MGNFLTTRRGLFKGGAAIATATATGVPALPAAAAKPVVGLHMDQPFVDWSGQSEPLRLPSGARGGDFAADLDEMAWRRLEPYV